MKKLTLLFLLSSPLWSFAQSISIDPNFIQFPKLNAAPTCAVADKGKQYFNTIDNKMYFCNGSTWVEMSGSFTLPYSGTGASNTSLVNFTNTDTGHVLNLSNTNTGTSSILSISNNASAGVGLSIANESSSSVGADLLIDRESSGAGNAIVVNLYSPSNSGNGIRVNSAGTGYTAFFTNSNPNPKALHTFGALQLSGIGENVNKILTSDATGNATWQSTATLTGLKLTPGAGPDKILTSDINGNATWQSTASLSGFQLTGNGAGADKVLTSDANGIATWQTISSTSSFRAKCALTTNFSVPNNTETLMNWLEDFDVLLCFDPVHDYFIAKENGIYHFDVSIKWSSAGNASNFVKTTLKKCDSGGNNCTTIVQNKENNQEAPNQTFGVDVPLSAGETVKVFVFQTQGSSRNIEGSNEASTFFSGHYIK
jgi:hypothetical protein